MAKDFRSFMQQVRDALPDEFLRIEREVDPRFEATAVLRKLELAGRSPLTVFARAKALDGRAGAHPLVFNAFSTRAKLCLALDMDPADRDMPLSLELNRRYAGRIPPVAVGADEAPVKEMRARGADCGFNRLPVPVHHALDGGPYILGGVVITRDPDTGAHNLALARIQVKGDRHAVIHAEPHHHTGMILKKYGELGQKAPVAVAIGHHPAFYLGSLWEGAKGAREYDLCGAALGEALRLAPSETWGDAMPVPADAEMVLECEADWNAREDEGPVGEYTRHYKNIRGGTIIRNADPALELLAVTSRRDAHFQSLFIAHAEHMLLASVPKEAIFFERIRAVCPGLRQVHIPPSGGRHICQISLAQNAPGEAREAILAAFACDRYLKYVIAVDEDVDAFNDAEVRWAVAMRTQPARDAFVIPETAGSPVDPAADPATGFSSKMGIDATRPFGKPFPAVCDLPRELLDSLKLEDYLP